MEPITTSAMIGGIVTYLGTQLAKDKSIKTFLAEFSGATVDWIKPLFLKEDDTPTPAVKDLQENPEDKDYQDQLKNKLRIAAKKNPEVDQSLKALYDQISKTEEGGRIVNNIINSKNVNTGNVNTGGGDFRLGDG